ncbi:MAG: ferredoxin family protein [Vulcanimicrobiota bacterium]
MKKDEEKEVRFGESPEKALKWIKTNMEESGDKVVVARGWCKRCGVCVSICPVKALYQNPDGTPGVLNDKCISCGSCEISCPDFAIVVSDLKGKNK